MAGLSISELARRRGVGRSTGRQALGQAEPPPRKPRVRTVPRLETFKAAIDAMLREDWDCPIDGVPAGERWYLDQCCKLVHHGEAAPSGTIGVGSKADTSGELWGGR